VHKHGGPPEKKKPCQSDETRVIQEDGIIDRIEAESVHKKKRIFSGASTAPGLIQQGCLDAMRREMVIQKRKHEPRMIAFR
jgi:hypothetical protein